MLITNIIEILNATVCSDRLHIFLYFPNSAPETKVKIE